MAADLGYITPLPYRAKRAYPPKFAIAGHSTSNPKVQDVDRVGGGAVFHSTASNLSIVDVAGFLSLSEAAQASDKNPRSTIDRLPSKPTLIYAPGGSAPRSCHAASGLKVLWEARNTFFQERVSHD